VREVTGWVRRQPELVLLSVAFLIGRGLVAVQSNPRIYFDSRTYRPPSGHDFTALISLTGHSARSWVVPAFYWLFPTDHQRILAQAFLSTMCWLALAAAVVSVLSSRVGRAAGAAVVLVMGSLPQVVNWDADILAESLETSFAALALAAVLMSARRRTWPRVAIVVVVLVLWCFVRPDNIVLVLGGGLLLAACALRRERGQAAVIATCALVGCLWSSWAVGNADDEYQAIAGTHVGYSEELFFYELALRVYLTPGAADYLARQGMPPCHPMDRLLQPDQARPNPAETSVLFVAYQGACPETRQWARTHARWTLGRFALSHPDVYLGWLRTDLSQLLSSPAYGDSRRLVPAPLERLLFGGPAVAVQTLLLEIMAGFLLLIAGGRRVWRAPLGPVAVVTIGLAAASLAVGYVFSANEVARSGVPEDVLLRLAAGLCAVAGVDALLSGSGRSWRRSARAGRTPSGEWATQTQRQHSRAD
jgi:hypothetical protein